MQDRVRPRPLVLRMQKVCVREQGVQAHCRDEKAVRPSDAPDAGAEGALASISKGKKAHHRHVRDPVLLLQVDEFQAVVRQAQQVPQRAGLPLPGRALQEALYARRRVQGQDVPARGHRGGARGQGMLQKGPRHTRFPSQKRPSAGPIDAALLVCALPAHGRPVPHAARPLHVRDHVHRRDNRLHQRDKERDLYDVGRGVAAADGAPDRAEQGVARRRAHVSDGHGREGDRPVPCEERRGQELCQRPRARVQEPPMARRRCT